MTKQKTNVILKTQTKEDETSKKREKILLRNLRKGGAVQWDSELEPEEAEEQIHRNEVRTDGTVR